MVIMVSDKRKRRRGGEEDGKTGYETDKKSNMDGKVKEKILIFLLTQEVGQSIKIRTVEN